MATTSTVSADLRLLEHLQTARAPQTAASLARSLRLTPSRVRFLISELRQDGHPIYRSYDQRKRQYVYELGAATQMMVATAAAVLGNSIFVR